MSSGVSTVGSKGRAKLALTAKTVLCTPRGQSRPTAWEGLHWESPDPSPGPWASAVQGHFLLLSNGVTLDSKLYISQNLQIRFPPGISPAGVVSAV